MTILLHGFWGQPSDWNEVLKRLDLFEETWIPDLYEAGPLSPRHLLDKWTSSFINEVHRRFAKPVQLVGYSMGGRLALNAAVQAPELFSRTLILSSAASNQELDFTEREAWERSWVNKFLRNTWEQLELEWQEQSVFSGSDELKRRQPSVTLREELGLSLLHWSPRLHEFTDSDLKALAKNVDFAFGALDQKYLRQSKILQELPVKGQISVIPNLGHRLITSAPAFVAEWIAAKGHK